MVFDPIETMDSDRLCSCPGSCEGLHGVVPVLDRELLDGTFSDKVERCPWPLPLPEAEIGGVRPLLFVLLLLALRGVPNKGDGCLGGRATFLNVIRHLMSSPANTV